MQTSGLLSSARNTVSRRRRRRRQQHSGLPVLESLEARQLLTTAMMWDGDALQITGSQQNDFIAVQQDELGLKVFTRDAVLNEYQGRSFDTAASVHVSGGAGADVLVSYQTDIPVSLSGDDGNDFLFADKAADVLDGGDGYDWIQATENPGLSEDVFGIPGLNPDSGNLAITPRVDNAGRIGFDVEAAGNVDLAGQTVHVAGLAEISNQGVDVAVTGSVSDWDDAFGIQGVDLTDTSLTVRAGTDVQDGNGYRVEVDSNLQVSGTDISIEGAVEVLEQSTTGVFTGSVANWDSAFGIQGLDLANAELTATGSVDADDNQSFSVGVAADMHVEDTAIDVSGTVSITEAQTDATLHGSVARWDDAFGITGLDLTDSQVNVQASTNHQDDYSLHVDLLADLHVEDTGIAVSGSVDITPDAIDAAFQGALENWDDAFGIDNLNLENSDIRVEAYSDRQDDYNLRVDLSGDLDIDGTKASVAGSVDIQPDRMSGTLTGSVAANWDDAFGIAGLDLKNTALSVHAVRDDAAGNSLSIGVDADMDVSGTDVALTGAVDVDADGVSGSLTGTVAGTWTSAFGIVPLRLQETTITVAGSRTSSGSEMSLGVAAGMNLLGTDVGVSGAVEVTPTGVSTTLTGSVAGEWTDAFGIPALQLRDTALSITAGSDSDGIGVGLDTDLHLFGGYIDMIGDLGISPEGVNVSFSPPASLTFIDLLGIDGFSLSDANLTVTAGTGGLEVAVASTMDMGNVDVDFEGAFSVAPGEIEASLTGRIAQWDDAFAVSGLDLDDVVLTLGAESGPAGASMYIGVGAGMEIGTTELAVAGLVGFGTTGWEVAFRGEVDAVSGDDLIDFANTLNQAADPDAATIPDGALGDVELRTVFINFAPRGGNEALGIADGFGIGGAFYNDGELLGAGAFVVDLAGGVFEARLEIPELDLGPVEMIDVIVDMRLAPLDSHFRAAGTAEMMGATVALDGTISSGDFSLAGTAAVDIQGLAASATFYADATGVRFVATAGGAAVNAIKQNVTKDVRAAATVAQKAIDAAQAVVDTARSEVSKLEVDLAAARTAAQKRIDAVKAELAKAKAVVNSANSSKSYWYKQRQSRYSSWRKAVAATKRAPWYKKAYYKGIEASRYASYKYAAGRYAAQVAVHKAAVVAYNAIQDAAGWALDNAGVEASPDVIRIKALLVVANVSLDAAELVLDGVEKANAAVLQALDQINSLKVNRITITGDLANYLEAGVSAKIESEFSGRKHTLNLEASTKGLTEKIGKELLAAIF